MSLWKREKSYVYYRFFHEAITDKFDFFYRLATKQGDLPPYSLRNLVGGAKGFKDVGPWFLNEFQRLDLFRPNCRILDVGCGCGRLAFTFSTDPNLRKLNVRYVGMDIDRKSIHWCHRRINSKNDRFQFYHADLRNRSYNPAGKYLARDFRFPHPDRSFDLIILTSVFTHLLEEDLRNYLLEMFRLLDTDGRMYASFFTYRSRQEAINGTGRHPLKFPFFHDHFASSSEQYSENAVAYEESFLMELLSSVGFRLCAGVMYGTQDAFLLGKQSG